MALAFFRSCLYVFAGVVLLVWAVELAYRYWWVLILGAGVSAAAACGDGAPVVGEKSEENTMSRRSNSRPRRFRAVPSWRRRVDMEGAGAGPAAPGPRLVRTR